MSTLDPQLDDRSLGLEKDVDALEIIDGTAQVHYRVHQVGAFFLQACEILIRAELGIVSNDGFHHEMQFDLLEEIDGTAQVSLHYITSRAVIFQPGITIYGGAILPPPSISALDPTSGELTGGYSFTLGGSGFQAGATVAFGAHLATGVVVTPTQITGTVPAGDADGAVVVTVLNPDGKSDTTSFTYFTTPVIPPAFFELSPDLGFLDFNDHFDVEANPLLVQIDQGDLVIASAEERAYVKGVGTFQITLGGVVYDVPLAARRRLRVRNGGRVVWRSTTGQSGTFRFFREAPAVFEETELVRS